MHGLAHQWNYITSEFSETRQIDFVSNEAVARVFRRLADRLQGVVADTSMMTISSEYAAHFLEVYVKKTENAKFTGDRVRFLMLTLPFVVLDQWTSLLLR